MYLICDKLEQVWERERESERASECFSKIGTPIMYSQE